MTQSHENNEMAREWDESEKIKGVEAVQRTGNAVSIQNPAIEGERTYLSSLTTATMATSKALLLVAVFALFWSRSSFQSMASKGSATEETLVSKSRCRA